MLEELLKQLGFERASLGHPPTETQMRTNRKAVWCLTGMLFIGGFMGLESWWAFDLLAQTETPGWTAIAIAYFPAFFSGMAIAASGLYNLTDRLPMSSGFCPQVASWVNAYDEIRTHVAAINRHGRPMAMCDYYLMRPWVEERESERRTAEARQACKSLHGIQA